MGEPKRFWIAPKLYSPVDPVEAEYYVAYDQPGDPQRLEIPVIEYSAYERLERALEKSRDTLKSAEAAVAVFSVTAYGKYNPNDPTLKEIKTALAEIEAIKKGE